MSRYRMSLAKSNLIGRISRSPDLPFSQNCPPCASHTSASILSVQTNEALVRNILEKWDLFDSQCAR